MFCLLLPATFKSPEARECWGRGFSLNVFSKWGAFLKVGLPAMVKTNKQNKHHILLALYSLDMFVGFSLPRMNCVSSSALSQPDVMCGGSGAGVYRIMELGGGDVFGGHQLGQCVECADHLGHSAHRHIFLAYECICGPRVRLSVCLSVCLSLSLSSTYIHYHLLCLICMHGNTQHKSSRPTTRVFARADH